MPQAKQASRTLFHKLEPHLWWVSLVLASALLITATSRRIERVEALSSYPTWSTPAPAIDATSPTGLEGGQRSLIVTGHHNPSFAWITEAQQAAEKGLWKIRYIDYDSAPDGRTTSRTSPYRWWLISIGWIHALASDVPLGYAIERASLYADPILLALLLVGGALYCRRYLSSTASAGYSIACVSIYPLSANFQGGAPDHHSLAWTLAMASLLPLFASLGSARNKRSHSLLAGSAGALALWNDAASQFPILLAILVGGIAFELLRKSASPASERQSHWRAWSFAGAALTLAASLFEFGLSSFTNTLESTSPIHAITILGIGEWLHAANARGKNGLKGFDKKCLPGIALGAIALLAWPIAGFLTDSATLFAGDFYARQLANHPAGGIDPHLGAWLGQASGTAKLACLMPPLALPLLFLSRIFSAKCEADAKARFAFGLVPLLLSIALGIFQLRWWNLFDIVAIIALVLLVHEASKDKQLARLAALLLFIPGLIVGFPPKVDTTSSLELSPTETQLIIQKDFAYWLNKRSGGEPITLFSSPLFSAAAAYYGGFRTIASTDDENELGKQTAIRIASAGSAQETSILLNASGITHIALPLWDPMLNHFVRIGLKVPSGQELPPNAFAVALRDWEVPVWLRTLNYQTPHVAPFKDYRISSFALGPEQSPELGLSRLADIFVENGQLWEAKSIREALLNYPRDLNALGAIANIDYALGDPQQLEESLEMLIPYLSRRSARDLPADRRINLASLFVRTQRIDLAKEQLQACLADLDTETLRLLTPTATASLLFLSKSLGIPFPDPKLKEQALELIAPSLRSELAK
ncbi:hypothetical protein QEH56_08410 [Pelagicoccus enzymogenes]|uniref:tetratricopeptide repeat protein n=1 Tax=Pelagicoccus enzymogenes TaxID=2773457 RepID=UPI00280F3EBD|nr:hypothetical protein [Pelagicoccus enzymogenes]MDQ8198165.1 hypothetical protein [Pelagicoccus enzymogenes]